jgi:hypothetical protein
MLSTPMRNLSPLERQTNHLGDTSAEGVYWLRVQNFNQPFRLQFVGLGTSTSLPSLSIRRDVRECFLVIAKQSDFLMTDSQI